MIIQFIFLLIFDILINISCMNDSENKNIFNGISYTILEVEKIKYEIINLFFK